MQLDDNYLQLYEEALRYAKVGDVYTAVKLLKKVNRIVPDWPGGYLALGELYFGRREWKPAFHYLSKTVGLNADDREAWWKLGLAAAGLKRQRTAQNVWNKFGAGTVDRHRPLGLQIGQAGGEIEILWMQPLDAARGRILSIPHPGSRQRYRDLVLYDRRNQAATTVVQQRRVAIYPLLDTLKKSPYRTFSCLLHTSAEEAIDQLEQLCLDAGLGFEVWSNASRSLQLSPDNAAARDSFPEYYADLHDNRGNGTALVALAAIHPAEVERVLNDWQIITLAQYSDLRNY